MGIRKTVTVLGWLMMSAVGAWAQPAAGTPVCITIDEAHDMLTPGDRTAAILLASAQFERTGERVVPPGCQRRYTLTHIMLGRTIHVTLQGPEGEREGTAIGLDDLPALYSQMVRALLTGHSMDSMSIIDRTNVTVAQATPQRVQSDSFGYARLGYGSVFGDRAYGIPSMGFGFRVELDAIGIDVSFLNFDLRPANSYDPYGSSPGANSFGGTLVKLQGLYFLNPLAGRSAYMGGGMGWGWSSFGSGGKNWDGAGLQGQVTVGYELARATTLRLFTQAEASFPFYQVTSNSVTYLPPSCLGCIPRRVSSTSESRYAPSLTLSIGLGWDRHRH